jgi:hypothetical protein
MEKNRSPEATAQYFETPEYASIAVRENIEIALSKKRSEEAVLDGFLTTIKWIFLYFPGAAAIHFTMMAFALFYLDLPAAMLIGMFGIFAVSTFMVMLGIGKLSDLKYLKVVAALVATGGLAAIIYAILEATTGGQFFGWFLLLSFPVSLLVAQLVKRSIDE